MSASFVAASQAGDSQTVQTATLSVPLPVGAAAGNSLVVAIDNSASTNTLTTPTGWTILSGPDANSTNAATWLLGKDLTSADITAGSVATTFGTAARVVDVALCSSGVTVAGAMVAMSQDTSATGTMTLPTLAGVPAGSMLLAVWERRRSGAAGAITVPSPYTSPTSGDAQTTYGSGVNVYADSGWFVTTAGGSVGGESATSGITSVGNNYLVALSPATAAASASGSFTVGGSVSAQAPAAASGSITFGGAATARAADTAAGSFTLSGAATPSGLPPGAHGSFTVGGTVAAQARASAAGTFTIAGSAAVQVKAAGAFTIGGSVTARAPASAAGTFTVGGTAAAQVTAVFWRFGAATIRTLAGVASTRRLFGDPTIRTLVGVLEV